MLTAGEGPDVTSPTGAGRVLSLIRDGEAVTRADLARRTGLARSTVAQRVEALLAHQLVYEAGGSASTGGGPPPGAGFQRGGGGGAGARPRCWPSTAARASCWSPISGPRTRGWRSPTWPGRPSPSARTTSMWRVIR